jgi:hypothetical protein
LNVLEKKGHLGPRRALNIARGICNAPLAPPMPGESGSEEGPFVS